MSHSSAALHIYGVIAVIVPQKQSESFQLIKEESTTKKKKSSGGKNTQTKGKHALWNISIVKLKKTPALLLTPQHW